MDCNGVKINTDSCIRGRQVAGRGAFARPVGFVIHSLGMTLDQYRAQLSRKYQPKIRTVYPKSVNYVITRAGFAEAIVPVGNTPAAFDRTWHMSYALYPPNAQNPNEPFVHIAFEDSNPTSIEIAAAANLICCLSRSMGITLDQDHIIPAFAIDVTRQPESVSDMLVAQSIACTTAGGYRATFDECCDKATQAEVDIAALQAQIATMQAQIGALQSIPNPAAQLAQIDNTLATLMSNVTALQLGSSQWASTMSSLSSRMAALEACMGKLPQCAACIPAGEFLSAISRCQNIVPNIPAIIDFDRAVSDPDHVVTPGVMWAANIANNTSNPIQYTISGSLVIEPTQWCAGKFARVLLTQCDGSQVEVARYTAPSNGDQPAVTLAWSHPVVAMPATTCEVRVRLEITDTTTPFKSVCTGAIEGRRS